VPLLITPYTPHLYFERSPQRDAHRHNIPRPVFLTLVAALCSPLRNAFFNTKPLLQRAAHKHLTHRLAQQIQRSTSNKAVCYFVINDEHSTQTAYITICKYYNQDFITIVLKGNFDIKTFLLY
jgi:hypothetical protein